MATKRNKKEQEELMAFARRHEGIAQEVAVTMLSMVEEEKTLSKKVKSLQAGLLSFVLLIRDKEAEEN